MPLPDARTPARDAIAAFLQHLDDQGRSATTRRIRKTYLTEYLRHAQQAAADEAAAADGDEAAPGAGPGPAEGAPPPQAAAGPLTAGDLMDAGRAAAWLADAAAGKTRTRNTS